MAEVADAYQVSWPMERRALDAHASQVLGEPEPTPLLGTDETRFGAARWVRGADRGWVRLEGWQTGFVDLRCPRTEGGQGLLGQVDGRAARSVTAWLAEPRRAHHPGAIVKITFRAVARLVGGP